MVADSFRDNVAVLLPSLAILGLILLIPRAAHQSLEYYRALQAYDAQPAPGPDRSLARPQKPSKTCNILATVLAMGPSFAIAFVYSTVTLDDGTRPTLRALRSNVPPLFAGSCIYLALCPFLLRTRLITLKLLSRGINIDTNKAMGANLIYRFDKQGARALLVSNVVLSYASLQLASWALRLNSTLAEVLIAAAGAVSSMRFLEMLTMNWPGKSSLRSRLVVLGIVLGAVTAMIALFAAIIAIGLYFDGDSSAVEKKVSDADKDSFWDRWGEAASSDIVMGQFINIYSAYIWCMALPFTADLLAFTYRFDVYSADNSLVILSGDERKQILHVSTTAAQEHQRASGTKHPWDDLGRYGVDMRAVRVPAAKRLSKPIFRAAVLTLMLVQILETALEYCFVPRSIYLHRMPTSNAKVPGAMEPGAVYMGNLAPFIAYPFCLLAIIGAAWWHGGGKTLRRLWAYNETWSCDYLGVPDEGNGGKAGDDATASEKVANESGSEGASEPLLLLSEDEERQRAENLA